MKEKIPLSSLDAHKSIRSIWIINPKTRIKRNDKIYNRAKQKQQLNKEIKNGS